jgi:hypothetical protein
VGNHNSRLKGARSTPTNPCLKNSGLFWSYWSISGVLATNFAHAITIFAAQSPKRLGIKKRIRKILKGEVYFSVPTPLYGSSCLLRI